MFHVQWNPSIIFRTPLRQLKVSWLKEMSSFQGCPYNRGVTLYYVTKHTVISWVSTHECLNITCEFGPTWALTQDQNSIRLYMYRSCYIDPSKWGHMYAWVLTRECMGTCPGHYGTTYLHGRWWFGPFDGSSIVRRHRGAISEALYNLVEPSLDVLPPVDNQHRHQRLHLVSQVFPVVTLHCTEDYHALWVCVCVEGMA